METLPVVQVEIGVDLVAADLVVALGRQDSVPDGKERITALIQEPGSDGASSLEEEGQSHAAQRVRHHSGVQM